MTLRQRILAIVGAVSLLGVLLTPGAGYGHQQVATSSVTILPGGPLRVTLAQASIDRPERDVQSDVQSGYLMVRVLDERGYASGWNVWMSALDYAGPAGHIGADQLTVSPESMSVNRGNPDLAGHMTYALDPMSTSPSLLWAAGNLSGDGEYDLMLESTMGLPGGQRAGYLYTVILNIDGIAP